MRRARFQSQRAVVTGASAGIGAAFARALHAEGATVVLVARREDRLRALAAELEAIRPGSTEVFPVDLTGSGSGRAPEAFLEMLRDTRVDVLVNNAGFGSFGPFESLPLDRECRMIDLNVTAVVAATHAVLPQMKERKGGAILVLSSLAGFQPLPFMATYAATKAFELVHALALSQELRPFGVRVLAVCPGPVATEFGGVARVPGTVTGGRRDDPELVVRKSIDALERGVPVVIPGVRANVLGLASRVLPARFTTWLVGRTLRSVWKAATAGGDLSASPETPSGTPPARK